MSLDLDPHATSFDARGLVLEQRRDRRGEGFGIAGRREGAGLLRDDLAIARDVRGDNRCRAREGPRDRHPEALIAEGRRHEELRRRELLRDRLIRDEAQDVDPLLRDAEPGEQQPHGQRLGAEHPQADPAGAQTGPGPQQHRQALARVVAAGEDDAVAGVDPVRDLDAVRDHLVVTGRIRGGRESRLLRDGYAQVDPTEQEAPQRLREPTPRRVAGRVKRRDHRSVPERERGRAEHRRERLVHVDEVEALAGEHAAHPRYRARAQDEVRERAVAGHDHRAAERDHAGRRRAWPALARVEDAAERAGWVVADQEPCLDPDRLEGAGLRVGMVDDAAAERPRVRHDDPDLHPGRGYRRRASTRPRTAPASRSCASTEMPTPCRPPPR